MLNTQITHIVLLPGLDGTGLLFKPLIDVLPQQLVPLVINYPTDILLGYEELLVIVLKQLPTDTPFIILGESFSGPLSILIAEKSPKQLKGIILCASFITCPYPFIPYWTKWLIPNFIFRPAAAIAKLNSYFGGYYNETLHQALVSVEPKVFAYRLKEVIKIDVSAALLKVPLPIFYLQGKRDLVVQSHNLKRILQLKPSVEYAQIDTSHMLLQNKPNEAASLIDRFVRKSILPEAY